MSIYLLFDRNRGLLSKACVMCQNYQGLGNMEPYAEEYDLRHTYTLIPSSRISHIVMVQTT